MSWNRAAHGRGGQESGQLQLMLPSSGPFLRAKCTRPAEVVHVSDRPVFWPMSQLLNRHLHHLAAIVAPPLPRPTSRQAPPPPPPPRNIPPRRAAGASSPPSAPSRAPSTARHAARHEHRSRLDPHAGEARSHQPRDAGGRAVARRKLDALRRRAALHAEAAAGRRPSPTASRSRPTTWCFPSRRCTTRRPAARWPIRCRRAARSCR